MSYHARGVFHLAKGSRTWSMPLRLEPCLFSQQGVEKAAAPCSPRAGLSSSLVGCLGAGAFLWNSVPFSVLKYLGLGYGLISLGILGHQSLALE